VSAFRGTEVADGETLHGGRPALWSTEPAENALIRVTISPEAVPNAPAAWFVSVPEPRAEPPAVNLVAYLTDHFPAGTVINRYQFGSLGLPGDEQAGAIRWLFQYGLVHQVFVAPQWRRAGLGTVLVYAASAFHQANGWPGRLHGNGQRTELGERFATALDHPGRIAPLEETMPPMDAAAPPVE
jgi:GNAT superfamily N-acetyltransferase